MSISNISSKKLTGISALQHWESEFLSIAPRRRLLGKPIWAYKVTDEELTSLRYKLKGMLGGKSPSVVLTFQLYLINCLFFIQPHGYKGIILEVEINGNHSLIAWVLKITSLIINLQYELQ